jgi:hypothetical protein
MGDFAAGKMGTYSGPTGTASIEDVAQAIVDLEALYKSKVTGAALWSDAVPGSMIPTPSLACDFNRQNSCTTRSPKWRLPTTTPSLRRVLLLTWPPL